MHGSDTAPVVTKPGLSTDQRREPRCHSPTNLKEARKSLTAGRLSHLLNACYCRRTWSKGTLRDVTRHDSLEHPAFVRISEIDGISDKTTSTPSCRSIHKIIAPRVTNFQRLSAEIILLSSTLLLGYHHSLGEIHIQDSGAWDACAGAFLLFQVRIILHTCASSVM
jgi:hypothetical protein